MSRSLTVLLWIYLSNHHFAHCFWGFLLFFLLLIRFISCNFLTLFSAFSRCSYNFQFRVPVSYFYLSIFQFSFSDFGNPAINHHNWLPILHISTTTYCSYSWCTHSPHTFNWVCTWGLRFMHCCLRLPSLFQLFNLCIVLVFLSTIKM